jgi:hypothetical protein
MSVLVPPEAWAKKADAEGAGRSRLLGQEAATQ